MKCIIPEISWHNRDPVLSVDIQTSGIEPEFYRLVSGGTDSHVLIWHVTKKKDGVLELECVCDLTRHQKAVNAVKFSPDGKFLASADDESHIIIWKRGEKTDVPDLDGDSSVSNVENVEHWVQVKVLRGHLEDIYDLYWSPDSLYLASGSVDNTCIVWDVEKGKRLSILADAKNFIQGVCWDPLNKHVATISSDGKCRIYNAKTHKLTFSTGRCRPPGAKADDKAIKLFQDDTLRTYFRRLQFSPDGQLLTVPAGIIESDESNGARQNVTWLFTRKQLNRCALYYPHGREPSMVTRWCPLKFKLRPDVKPIIALPYRMILAVATRSSIIIYDSQCAVPIGLVSNIHYTKLTDLTWSADATILIASSTDGYCSVVTFAAGELGEVYVDTAVASECAKPDC
ncbi:Chromatin assembly factor 1 subunit [Nesidiocoris tenuis]|uniref:Chromatin assembly factor 1 subunit n=1 Tax=Nesidiocoris tenuis TaxID=355587 RepID=A0ABN7AMX4_9HEMI|nr:Chromatin assembly factor 1 subunit [Nesidiocoris tenuis]